MSALFFSRITLICLSCLLLFPAAVFSLDKSDYDQSAVAVAEKWIAVIDAGNYEASWQEASDLFRSVIPRQRWIHRVPLIREPLGSVLDRSVEKVSFIASNPGFDDEQSAVIRFKTSFLKLRPAIETVMLTSDKDGHWRIAGYYITSGYLNKQGLNLALLVLLVIIAAWYLELRPRGGNTMNQSK